MRPPASAQAAVLDALGKAQPRHVTKLAAIKRPFKFRVRHFDEAAEEAAVDALLSEILRPR